jgi:hypothetical protein
MATDSKRPKVEASQSVAKSHQHHSAQSFNGMLQKTRQCCSSSAYMDRLVRLGFEDGYRVCRHQRQRQFGQPIDVLAGLPPLMAMPEPSNNQPAEWRKGLRG